MISDDGSNDIKTVRVFSLTQHLSKMQIFWAEQRPCLCTLMKIKSLSMISNIIYRILLKMCKEI